MGERHKAAKNTRFVYLFIYFFVSFGKILLDNSVGVGLNGKSNGNVGRVWCKSWSVEMHWAAGHRDSAWLVHPISQQQTITTTPGSSTKQQQQQQTKRRTKGEMKEKSTNGTERVREREVE